jgi:DNA-binding NarL/FixJ family response regulator
MTSIRILVVDDHELVRRNICNILTLDPDLDVVCQASSGYEAIRKSEELQPDVILLDISLPELNGLMATPLIKKVSPKAEVLIVTSHDNLFFVREAFAAGAQGFLSKSDVSAELISAVRQVHSKKRFVSKNMMAVAVEHNAGKAAW